MRRAARRAGLVLVAALTVTGLTASPSWADVTPDQIAAAQQQVQAVSDRVSQVALQLTVGTQRWQAGTAELARTQQQAAQAAAQAQVAQAAALARQRTLSDFLVADYKRTSAGTASLLTEASQTGGVIEALRAGADLDRIRGSQAEALADAKTAKEQADQADAQARALQDRAAAQEQVLAKELADLRDLAARTNADLQAAFAQLSTLQAQAAAEQALATGAPPPPVGALPAGACTGAPTAGFANGAIPPAALCPLDDAPGQMLRADAAAAYNQLDAYARQTRGAALCITDSYRSYDQQVTLFAVKPNLAAVPGTSNHGWGVAVDFCGGVETAGSPAFAWMKANAARFGWVHPAWAEPGGSRPEPWHWEYVGGAVR